MSGWIIVSCDSQTDLESAFILVQTQFGVYHLFISKEGEEGKEGKGEGEQDEDEEEEELSQ